MIPKAKKPKKPATHRPTKTPFDYVKMTNYLNLAVIVRVLWTVYGWRSQRVWNFIEAYVTLMEEVCDKRSGVESFIRDTKEMTGIDVRELLDEIMVR